MRFVKEALFVVLFLGLLSTDGARAALSDSEYQELAKTSAVFKKTDHDLSAVWKQLYDKADPEYKKILLKGQREWVKNRAANALNYMEEDGLTMTQAYTLVTRERWNVLRALLDNLNVPEEDAMQGRGIKADDYYNSDEDGIEEVRKQIPLNTNTDAEPDAIKQGVKGALGSATDMAKALKCCKDCKEEVEDFFYSGIVELQEGGMCKLGEAIVKEIVARGMKDAAQFKANRKECSRLLKEYLEGCDAEVLECPSLRKAYKRYQAG